MPDLVFTHDCVILDASCVISLFASKKMGDILESIPKSITVAAYVRDKEALWVYDGPDDNITQAKEPIDLQPFIQRGVLTIVSLDSETEENTFIDFATVLDDGESITGAIAVHRRWAIATDDKKAIKFFMRQTPSLQIITTLELVKYWIDTIQPTHDIALAAIRNMQLRAGYNPDNKHPGYSWWQSYKGGE